MFERQCPECNKKIEYKSLRKFQLALKNNSFCRTCSRKKIKFEKFERNCPICEKKISHRTKESYDIARFLNSCCAKCSKESSAEKIYTRVCPTCDTQMEYKNKYNYYGAIRNNSNCLHCAAKELANREESKEISKKNLNTTGKNVYSMWVDRYGEEEADLKQKELNSKRSKNATGKNNPMYGKPSPKGSGNGWSGHYKNIHFRSLNELFYLKYLLDNNIKFDNAEKKKYRVEYEFNGRKRSYGMDFYLLESDEYIEIKPKKLTTSPLNSAKFKAARKVYGDKFKILTEDDLDVINTETMYQMYLDKTLIFDKRYEEKFLERIKI